MTDTAGVQPGLRVPLNKSLQGSELQMADNETKAWPDPGIEREKRYLLGSK